MSTPPTVYGRMHPELELMFSMIADFKKMVTIEKDEILKSITTNRATIKMLKSAPYSIISSSIVNKVVLNNVDKTDMLKYLNQIYKYYLILLIFMTNLENETVTETQYNALINQINELLMYEVELFGIIYHKKWSAECIRLTTKYSKLYKNYNKIIYLKNHIPTHLL